MQYDMSKVIFERHHTFCMLVHHGFALFYAIKLCITVLLIYEGKK